MKRITSFINRKKKNHFFFFQLQLTNSFVNHFLYNANKRLHFIRMSDQPSPEQTEPLESPCDNQPPPPPPPPPPPAPIPSSDSNPRPAGKPMLPPKPMSKPKPEKPPRPNMSRSESTPEHQVPPRPKQTVLPGEKLPGSIHRPMSTQLERPHQITIHHSEQHTRSPTIGNGDLSDRSSNRSATISPAKGKMTPENTQENEQSHTEFPPLDHDPPPFKQRTFKYPSGNEIGTATFSNFNNKLDDLLKKRMGPILKNRVPGF